MAWRQGFLPALLSLCPVRWEGYAQGVTVALAWVPEQRHSSECSPQSEGKSNEQMQYMFVIVEVLVA